MARSKTDGTQSAMLKWMNSVSKSLQDELKTESSRQRLFSETFRNSSMVGTPKAIRDWLMSCRQDFLASRSPSRGEGKARATGKEGTYGLLPFHAFASYDLDSHSWKTSPAYSAEDGKRITERGLKKPATSGEFLATWPKQGTMRTGVCWEQTIVAQTIKGKGFGYLPTPVSYDATPGGPQNHYRGLGHIAKHGKKWPTPTSTERSGINPKTGQGSGLSKAAKTWPTPHGFSKDGKSNGPSGNELGNAVNQEEKKTWPTPSSMPRGPHSGRAVTEGGQTVSDTTGVAWGMTLETAVKKWATPRVDDAKNKAGPSQLKRHGPALNVQAGGSLNPDWVEWLMQWPIGWTSLEPLDSEMFNVWMHKDDWWMDEPHIPRVATGVPNRVDRLKAIGNGQVPACVCVAWVLLLPKDAMVYRAGKRKRKQEMKE